MKENKDILIVFNNQGVRMKILKNQSGFTLVELMVVVAIIGILSAVAIPNFKKYQAKSKTSEAKLHLANIYTAESASMSDYDTYATCIRDMGIVQPPDKSNFYAFGFAAAYAGGVTTIENAGGVCDNAVIVYAQSKLPGGVTAVTAVTGTSASATAFTAAAEGKIVSGATTNNRWEINEAKAIVTNNGGM